MKRISFFLVILLALCFGQGMAATSIVLDGVECVPPLIGHPDTVIAGSVVKFHLKYINDSDSGFNVSNSWVIYSPEGASWTDSAFGNFHGSNLGPIGIDTTGLLPKSNFPTVYTLRTFSSPTASPIVRADGISPDTVAFSGAGAAEGQGLLPHTNARHFSILLQTKLADSNKTICIDSTMKFPPTNAWKWAALYGGTPGDFVIPAWSGTKCVFLWNVPNLAPNFTVCPTTIEGSHCNTLTTTVTAVDADGPAPITYALVSGPGAVNSATGAWSASGLAVGAHVVVISATDGAGAFSTCTFNVNVTNAGPTIACPAAVPTLQSGATGNADVNASDDCDVLTFSLGDVSGIGGLVTINPATGVVSYTPVDADAALPQPVTIPVIVSDGLLTATCNVAFTVIIGAPYAVEIEKVHNVFQGQYVDVALTLNTYDPAEGLGGFDLLIAYDNSALSFQKAFEGSIYAECGWEYFTYRFGANGNCSGGCPSGLVRVVGIAETNNGAWHPTCDVATVPTTLATLRFLVSNDRTFECMYVPIRFFWLDCTDNTLSNESGSILWVSSRVFDYSNDAPINNGTFGFPTYLGAQDECLTSTEKAEVLRGIDFQNGGVDIVCADSIDARGDINLNGLAYEIADAVMFTQYFIKGTLAFPQTLNGIQGAIAASDVNADGIPLSVGDLVYLIRVIIGDAAPYDKVNVTVANINTTGGIISVDAEMGAAYVVVAGSAEPKLLANNMTMISNFDGTNTHILVYPAFESLNHFQTFSGDFLQVSGSIVSVELGTPNGGIAKVVELPKAYSLNQNYPNPFNPSTVISFALPKAGDYTLSVYNVAGQKVTDFAGTASAGVVEIEWNANGLASGVYFYKLEAGDFTATKKAVLLK